MYRYIILLTTLVYLSQCQKLLNTTNWNRVLMVAAHPDDVEGCVGSTIYQLTQQNIEVHYVIVTNGDKGCGNPFCANWTTQQIAAWRMQEQYNAAAIIGVPANRITFLGYEDSMLTAYPEQDPRRDIVTAIRSIQPDVVMTWYPYPNLAMLPSEGWDDMGYHPDHQRSGKLTLDAIHFDASLGLLWPQAGPAWTIKEFYMWGFTEYVYYMPATQESLQMKIKAFLEHKSQFSDPEVIAQWLTWMAEEVALSEQLPTMYAEGFIPYF